MYARRLPSFKLVAQEWAGPISLAIYIEYPASDDRAAACAARAKQYIQQHVLAGTSAPSLTVALLYANAAAADAACDIPGTSAAANGSAVATGGHAGAGGQGEVDVATGGGVAAAHVEQRRRTHAPPRYGQPAVRSAVRNRFQRADGAGAADGAATGHALAGAGNAAGAVDHVEQDRGVDLNAGDAVHAGGAQHDSTRAADGAEAQAHEAGGRGGEVVTGHATTAATAGHDTVTDAAADVEGELDVDALWGDGDDDDNGGQDERGEDAAVAVGGHAARRALRSTHDQQESHQLASGLQSVSGNAHQVLTDSNVTSTRRRQLLAQQDGSVPGLKPVWHLRPQMAKGRLPQVTAQPWRELYDSLYPVNALRNLALRQVFACGHTDACAASHRLVLSMSRVMIKSATACRLASMCTHVAILIQQQLMKSFALQVPNGLFVFLSDIDFLPTPNLHADLATGRCASLCVCPVC